MYGYTRTINTYTHNMNVIHGLELHTCMICMLDMLNARNHSLFRARQHFEPPARAKNRAGATRKCRQETDIQTDRQARQTGKKICTPPPQHAQKLRPAAVRHIDTPTQAAVWPATAVDTHHLKTKTIITAQQRIIITCAPKNIHHPTLTPTVDVRHTPAPA